MLETIKSLQEITSKPTGEKLETATFQPLLLQPTIPNLMLDNELSD
jgi:hypothetical protein